MQAAQQKRDSVCALIVRDVFRERCVPVLEERDVPVTGRFPIREPDNVVGT